MAAITTTTTHTTTTTTKCESDTHHLISKTVVTFFGFGENVNTHQEDSTISGKKRSDTES
tara:strand:- start:147 stop:326 length:180 start_codon:yes stop_codon:yes gene_type:complete